MIYLDNSATTQPCPEAVEAMTKALTENWGNPSALYGFGIDTARALRSARNDAAAAMGAEPERVFFTSGGTEADNWAVFGTVKRLGKRGKHIITTAIEHPAILNCMKDLESRGFEVTYLSPDSQGFVSPDVLKAALRKDTILVSVMMVNNEVGSVMPIAQMARLTHRLCPDAIFHTDAVQGFLKVPFAAKSLGADLISVSSHKIHGPKGCGALYVSPRLKSFPPLLLGGGQESGFRSGTEGTPAIFGFAAACRAAGESHAGCFLRKALSAPRSADQRCPPGPPHPEPGGSRSSHPELPEHPPGCGCLCQRRLRLCQGPPQPYALRHESGPGSHRQLLPDFSVPGYHPGNAGYGF